MLFVWYLCSSCVVFVWCLCGVFVMFCGVCEIIVRVCVLFVQFLFGICVVFVWCLCGVCVVLVWCLCGVCVLSKLTLDQQRRSPTLGPSKNLPTPFSSALYVAR